MARKNRQTKVLLLKVHRWMWKENIYRQLHRLLLFPAAGDVLACWLEDLRRLTAHFLLLFSTFLAPFVLGSTNFLSHSRIVQTQTSFGCISWSLLLSQHLYVADALPSCLHFYLYFIFNWLAALLLLPTTWKQLCRLFVHFSHSSELFTF